MADDHLSNEVSLSIELSAQGLKFGAKSRIIASIERLLGGAVDLMSVPLERAARKGRAKTENEVSIIQELGQMQLHAINSDPDFAARAMQQHLKMIGVRYENKVAAIATALEELKETPPPDEDDFAEDVLAETFLNRWERYAEDATDAKLREKWGRVLASEIRTPGTFSGKVLRVVDELDASNAQLFERLCLTRVGEYVVRGLVEKLSYNESVALVAADLIIEPTLGQVRVSQNGSANDGTALNIINFDDFAVAFTVEIPPNLFVHDSDGVITEHNNAPAIPIYQLTDAGRAIASILPNQSLNNLRQLVELISQKTGGHEVRAYKRVQCGSYEVDSTAKDGRLFLAGI